MPEILTKHPDVALQVLKSQGAQCGASVKPKILTRCPADKFCVLNGGELCVYGAQEVEQMTQLSRAELCGVQAPKSAIAGRELETSAVLVLLVVGLGVALLRARRSRRRAR